VNFHVMRNDEGWAVDFVVEVQGAVGKRNYNGPTTCRCSCVYPVVMKSITSDHVRQGAKHDRQKFVCECHGHLVP
jgi:hypothetical protein